MLDITLNIVQIALDVCVIALLLRMRKGEK